MSGEFSSVDIFITNSRQEILLQLRDDKPDICWPAHWVTPGAPIRARASTTPWLICRASCAM
ncbi:hypothetical protein F7Q99_26060 [Streptomyces kaniharaensis]|uniref:Uncharacterized protein n=1 Tax=Streptomyces kaniharaensis TaxID=212423 RepID=A0A6N7KVT7_9ACTN|nr:hypothetical protein [Streptomyces kaniharaensis]